MLFHARATSLQSVVSCSFCEESELYAAVILGVGTNQASVLDSDPLRGDELLALVQETGVFSVARKDEIGKHGNCHRQDPFNEEDVPPLTMGTVQGTWSGIFPSKGNRVERTVP